jgi:hypothetical protein
MNPKTTERPFRCDCVKLKRAIQSQIYEETKYMTPEEQLERINRIGNAVWAEMKRRRAELASETQT